MMPHIFYQHIQWTKFYCQYVSPTNATSFRLALSFVQRVKVRYPKSTKNLVTVELIYSWRLQQLNCTLIRDLHTRDVGFFVPFSYIMCSNTQLWRGNNRWHPWLSSFDGHEKSRYCGIYRRCGNRAEQVEYSSKTFIVKIPVIRREKIHTD